MKLDLIKTGLTQSDILYDIPPEILDTLEVEFIQIYKQQKLITEKPTLKTVSQELIQKHEDPARCKQLIIALSKAQVLDRAEWELALFRSKAQAINKCLQQIQQLEDTDQKGYKVLLDRIQHLGMSKEKQYHDPINATQWQELTRAEEEEIRLNLDWLTENEVFIKKKVLYAFIATTNGGKTILKTWFAHKLIEVGQNVLYLAQEEPRTDTVRRIHQTTLGLTETQYAERTKESFEPITKEYIEVANAKGYGTFYVAEWPGIKVSSIEDWLVKYAEQHDTVIDAVIVDYGKLVETSDSRKNSQEWERIGLIFSELKQLAMKNNIAVLTSIQLNRDASKQLVEKGVTADLFDVAGAYEATHHVNYCWSVRLQGRQADGINYNDPKSMQGTYTLTVQKQKYGRLRKGDSQMFRWFTDHSLVEVPNHPEINLEVEQL